MTPYARTLAAGPAAPRRFLPVLLVLFVGSGCAALIYEVVWLQLLQLVIGSTIARENPHTVNGNRSRRSTTTAGTSSAPPGKSSTSSPPTRSTRGSRAAPR